MSTVKNTLRKNTEKSKQTHLRINDLPNINKISFSDNYIHFELTDKRIVAIPLSWSAKLKNATPTQRKNYLINGRFVFWDEIDEIIGVKNLFDGSMSA